MELEKEIDFNNQTGKKAKKPRKQRSGNKGLGIIITVVILLLLALAGATFGYMYVYTDTFKSNEELFFKYMMQNDDVLTTMNFSGFSNQQEILETSSYSSDGTLSVGIDMDGQTQELSFGLNKKFDLDSNTYYGKLALISQGIDLIDIEGINQNNEKLAFRIENVLPNYIALDVTNIEDLLVKYELEELFGNQIDIQTATGMLVEGDMISLEDAKYLSNIVLNTILENITEENFSKTEYEAATFTTYTLKIDSELTNKVFTEVLNKINNDDVAKYIIYTLLSSGEITIEEITDILNEVILEANTLEMPSIEISVTEEAGVTMDSAIKITSIDGQNITLKMRNSDEGNSSTTTFDASYSDGFETMQMQVVVANNDTVNNGNLNIKIYPDTTISTQNIELNLIAGTLANNTANNIYNITVNSEELIASISYKEIITIGEQSIIGTILEDENTVVINEFEPEIIIPFLEQYFTRSVTAVENSITLLGM